jgi:ferric-dicitrate binding protein FerR (iron transport regulator)
VSGEWRGVPEEDAVRQLLRDAGPRPLPPEDDIRAIRDAARAEWMRRYERDPRRRGRTWLAAAAVLLAGLIGLAWWTRARSSAVPPVASVERVSGPVRWKVRSPVVAGSVLDTDAETPGRVTLRMRGGASVRLDFATRVRFASATMVELERGAVYVDTGVSPRGSEDVTVRAGNVLVRPAGTQYQVRAGGHAAKVQVREGRVAVNRGTQSLVAIAGEEVVLSDDGRVLRRAGTLSGPDWAWVGDAAPMLAIEGVKLREFLSWISRETGLRVEPADGEAVAVADSCVLHGSIENVAIADAPGVVLSSCGLGHRISDGTLAVFVAKKGR